VDKTTVEHSIQVTETGLVDNLKVRVRLNHTWDSDVSIALVAPDGTVVDLSSANGSSGDNYGSDATDGSVVYTVFDDAATTCITAGKPPYEGSFSPEQPLSTVYGKLAAGTWTLRVTDRLTTDTGTLYRWGMDVTTCPLLCCTDAPALSMGDVAAALQINGGTAAPETVDTARLDVKSDAPAPECIDLTDAIAIARRLSGVN
jgi:subtilisin-like proprotein convertase family protein